MNLFFWPGSSFSPSPHPSWRFAPQARWSRWWWWCCCGPKSYDCRRRPVAAHPNPPCLEASPSPLPPSLRNLCAAPSPGAPPAPPRCPRWRGARSLPLFCDKKIRTHALAPFTCCFSLTLSSTGVFPSRRATLCCGAILLLSKSTGCNNARCAAPRRAARCRSVPPPLSPLLGRLDVARCETMLKNVPPPPKSSTHRSKLPTMMPNLFVCACVLLITSLAHHHAAFVNNPACTATGGNKKGVDGPAEARAVVGCAAPPRGDAGVCGISRFARSRVMRAANDHHVDTISFHHLQLSCCVDVCTR